MVLMKLEVVGIDDAALDSSFCVECLRYDMPEHVMIQMKMEIYLRRNHTGRKSFDNADDMLIVVMVCTISVVCIAPV